MGDAFQPSGHQKAGRLTGLRPVRPAEPGPRSGVADEAHPVGLVEVGDQEAAADVELLDLSLQQAVVVGCISQLATHGI